jgi:hypothetical protein
MSIAAVVSEYPSGQVQFGVYTTATGVSSMRVLGQKHFLTDVLIGDTAGWRLIGRYVSKKHGGS